MTKEEALKQFANLGAVWFGRDCYILTPSQL